MIYEPGDRTKNRIAERQRNLGHLPPLAKWRDFVGYVGWLFSARRMDTMDIAERLGEPEWVVYTALAEYRKSKHTVRTYTVKRT